MSYSLPPIEASNHAASLLHVQPSPPMSHVVARDKRYLTKIIDSGQFPTIDWSKVKRSFEQHIAKLTGKKKLSMYFLNVGRRDGDQEFVMGSSVSLDSLMEEKSAVGVVVHGKSLVYLCTFTSNLCSLLYEKAEADTNLKASLSTKGWDGIEKLAGKDTTQRIEPYVSYVSFGLSTMIQPTNPSPKTPVCKARLAAVGGCDQCTVSNEQTQHSLHSVVAQLYRRDFHPFFHSKRHHPRDDFYGRRLNGKKTRLQRFSGGGLQHCDKLYMMKPMNSSLPVSSTGEEYETAERQAAIEENRIRSISEYVLIKYFATLPYSSTGLIARNNIEDADMMSKNRHRRSLPWAQWARVFPKGTIGGACTKDLHDDENACVSPGIWTSIEGDEAVSVCFYGHRMNVEFSATSKRFCWFMGWIPHKCYMPSRPSFRSSGQMKRERVHHSAFSKPEYEHIGCFLFSRKYRTKAVSSLEFSGGTSDSNTIHSTPPSTPAISRQRRSPRFLNNPPPTPVTEAAKGLLSIRNSTPTGEKPTKKRKSTGQRNPTTPKRRSTRQRRSVTTRRLPMRAAKR